MVSDKLLSAAAGRYGFDLATLNFISASTNEIYMFTKNSKGYILRFSQRAEEFVHQIKAEMDWLYYLANKSIGVSLPLYTTDDEVTFCVEDDGKNWIVTSFETASGVFWDKNDSARWNETIFCKWGKIMGDIHRLTKDYTPSSPVDVREDFSEKSILDSDIKHCPPVMKEAEEIVAEMLSMSKNADGYNLVHFDVHPWNFLIDGDKINVFDFDDSVYGWLALDIGIALYHGIWWGRPDLPEKVPAFTEMYIKSFMNGYLSANKLSAYWIKKIPMFMRYRQISRFSWFFDPENPRDNSRKQMNLIKLIENRLLFKELKADEIENIFYSIASVAK